LNVLLTGASSFSGFWFAKALAAAGATVVAPLRGVPGSYSGVRGERVRRLSEIAEIVPDIQFGDERFLNLVSHGDFEVFCHHAAHVTDYRSPDFDVIGAVAANVRNFRPVLERMSKRGLKAVIATGSVFEQDEGLGNLPLRAFSPYGLSKGLTWQVIRHWSTVLAIPVGKFVIANPFGPLEEPRFTAYLIDCWSKGNTAVVRTPRYLRDNIHIDLLALAYKHFVFETISVGRSGRFGPSGYVETQGAFAERVAVEFRPRLGLKCDTELLSQTEFNEPVARINTDMIEPGLWGWSESAAWDKLAGYYHTGKDPR
jgi:UDP-glucose 4-epimerase